MTHQIFTDEFYEGVDTYNANGVLDDMPSDLCEQAQNYWRAGFNSTERRAKNPSLSREEYEKVAREAYKAGRKANKAGQPYDYRANPYCPDKEAERFDIWDTVYMDACEYDAKKIDDFILPTPKEEIG